MIKIFYSPIDNFKELIVRIEVEQISFKIRNFRLLINPSFLIVLWYLLTKVMVNDCFLIQMFQLIIKGIKLILFTLDKISW